MMRLALHEITLAGAATLPEGVHGLYLRRGALRLDGAVLAEDHAVPAGGGGLLEGEGEAWCFTACRAAAPLDHASLILAHSLPRDPAQPFVLRLDRVDFAENGVTPRHGHAGPGIRCLLSGLLLAELGEEQRRITPGQAWHESGAEPVVGRVLAPGTAFVRAMVLDAALLGLPSFRAWTPEEAAKPRGVGYRLFFDRICQLETT